MIPVQRSLANKEYLAMRVIGQIDGVATLTNTYSRRQKNGDVSVPFRSVQTETDTVSVQLKTENGVQ